jgi:hypothetical protein
MTTPASQTEDKLLPSSAFDYGTVTASHEVLKLMEAIKSQTLAHGLDIDNLLENAAAAQISEAGRWFAAVHDAASIFYLQWEEALDGPIPAKALALARIVNGLTAAGRSLNEKFEIVSLEHLQIFRRAIQDHHRSGHFDPKIIAQVMDEAALAHSHEKAWMSVILPTFAKQPYGRILLVRIDLDGLPSPVFVTQPFFLQRRTTLFHTHGQNWAFSRPLGGRTAVNTHTNTLWRPKSRSQPFPLELLDLQNYETDDVAILPPRVIHGISKKLHTKFSKPTLPVLLNDAGLRAEWILRTRFGEKSTLHLYHPCPDISGKLLDSPVVREDERFFIENDMIVFDHEAQTIWSGGGGSWPQRMVDFGPTGDHCGRCFENDPRHENLDPGMVWDWLIDTPSPHLQVYKSH